MGAEGNIQRALGDYYEWLIGTFYRKTVIWMETLVLENMARMMRVMAGVRRTAAPQR